MSNPSPVAPEIQPRLSVDRLVIRAAVIDLTVGLTLVVVAAALSILIVNYKTPEMLDRCLQLLTRRALPFGIEILVVLARNGLLFLLAWEFMAVSAFFLVTYYRRKPQAREAGWTYLVAAHLGSAFLMVMFVLLTYPGRSLDFANATSGQASLVFVLALVGFGTKAGFVPLHIWLPDAHAVAPAHIGSILVLQTAHRYDDAGVGDVRPVSRNRCARLRASVRRTGRREMQGESCGDARRQSRLHVGHQRMGTVRRAKADARACGVAA